MIDVVLPQIGAVDLDQAFVIAVEHLQQPGDRGLARPAAPHNAKDRAFGDGKADVIQRRAARARIAKPDAGKLNATDNRRADAIFSVSLLDRPIDHPSDQPYRYPL